MVEGATVVAMQARVTAPQRLGALIPIKLVLTPLPCTYLVEKSGKRGEGRPSSGDAFQSHSPQAPQGLVMVAPPIYLSLLVEEGGHNSCNKRHSPISKRVELLACWPLMDGVGAALSSVFNEWQNATCPGPGIHNQARQRFVG